MRSVTGKSVVVALAAVLALGSASAVAAPFPFESGEQVVISGRVTDAAGQGLRDLEVVLEASRLGLTLWPPGQVKRDVVRGTVRTDGQGEFAFEMTWNWRYNHFEVQVAVPVRGPDGERLHVLEAVDITRRLRQGSPVAVPVTLNDTRFLDNLREFVGALATADERRVYDQLGKPDRVDQVSFPDRLEVSWWYFQQGKVYRFVDGRLSRIEEFDPVRPL
jgi:hypothetical protein